VSRTGFSISCVSHGSYLCNTGNCCCYMNWAIGASSDVVFHRGNGHTPVNQYRGCSLGFRLVVI